MPRLRAHALVLVRLLLVALALCFPAVAPAGELAGELAGTVGRVIDGDTLVLRSGDTVRLLGIDAPELARDGQPAQLHAAEAGQALAGLAAGREVRLVEGPQARDRHGRLVAWVFLADGRCLNEIMVRTGNAFYYPHSEHDPSTRGLLLPAQIQAMGEGRGFWPVILALPAARAGYVGNRASLRFFPLDCPFAARVGARHRVVFRSLAEAFSAGFAPARPCLFWPPAR